MVDRLDTALAALRELAEQLPDLRRVCGTCENWSLGDPGGPLGYCDMFDVMDIGRDYQAATCSRYMRVER